MVLTSLNMVTNFLGDGGDLLGDGGNFLGDGVDLLGEGVEIEKSAFGVKDVLS